MATHQATDQHIATPLERLVDDYLIACRARGLSPRTDEQYSYSLNILLRWCADQGIAQLSELDRRTFDRYSTWLLAQRRRDGELVSKHGVHTRLRPVRLMLNWATREGETVLARPQLPRREKPVRDVLSRDEIDALERTAVNERDKLIIRVFADCGLRLDELTGLRATDIVRSGRQAHLRVLGKRSRTRDVPVPPSLLRRLDRFIESRPDDRTSDHIFLAYRRQGGLFRALTRMGVYQVVKYALRRARTTKHVYPHLLRHSWMTEMLRRGMNLIQLSVIAGASPNVIAQHYAHLTKDDAYDAMVGALAQPSRGPGYAQYPTSARPQEYAVSTATFRERRARRVA